MWGSHIPVLVEMLKQTTGPVLELGSGMNSTPILSVMCKKDGRTFESYDNNLFWIRILNGETLYVENFDDVPLERKWSFVLIDHDPSERRIVDIKRLVDYADYIVIHDSEPDQEFRYNYSEIYPLFKYRLDYKEFSTHTTILSNLKEITI